MTYRTVLFSELFESSCMRNSGEIKVGEKFIHMTKEEISSASMA